MKKLIPFSLFFFVTFSCKLLFIDNVCLKVFLILIITYMNSFRTLITAAEEGYDLIKDGTDSAFDKLANDIEEFEIQDLEELKSVDQPLKQIPE